MMDLEPSRPRKISALVPILVVAIAVVVAAAFLAFALSRSDPSPATPGPTATPLASATPLPTRAPTATGTAAARTVLPSPTPATKATPAAGGDAPPAAPSNLSASIVNWVPSTCTITVDVSWKDNSVNEDRFLIGPPSSKQVGFAGYIQPPANATSARFTFTYGGGTLPVFIWAIRDAASGSLWSEGPPVGIFLSPTPPASCG